MYNWVLNTALEEFVQDASRKEPALLSVVSYCINNELALSSTTDTLP